MIWKLPTQSSHIIIYLFLNGLIDCCSQYVIHLCVTRCRCRAHTNASLSLRYSTSHGLTSQFVPKMALAERNGNFHNNHLFDYILIIRVFTVSKLIVSFSFSAVLLPTTYLQSYRFKFFSYQIIMYIN